MPHPPPRVRRAATRAASRAARPGPWLALAAALVLCPVRPAAAQWCTNVTYDRHIGLRGGSDCSYASQQSCEVARRSAQAGVYTSPCYALGGAVSQAPPDPRVEAAQRVAPRLRELLARLSNPATHWKVLGDGWTTLPTGTPEEVQATLARLFDGLYVTYTSDFASNRDYRVALWQQEQLTARVAELEPRVASRKAELAERASQLRALQDEAARNRSATGQLEAAARAKEAATARLQDAAIGWIRATLPPARPDVATWGRWQPTFDADHPGPGETWQAALTVEPGRELAERPQAAAAAAVPAFAPDPKPALPASIDERFAAVSQLADKAHAERLQYLAANDGGRQALQARLETLRGRLAEDERLELTGDILASNLRVQLDRQANDLARLKNSEETLAKRHAAAALLHWTWENAKEELVRVIKIEVTRQVLATGTGRPVLRVDDLEVEQAIEHGRANMFGLTDDVMHARDLVEIVRTVHALANHTGDYAAAVVRYVNAPPERLDALAREVAEGLDHDTRALEDASLKATGLREPFGAAWLLFTRRRPPAGY